jgi:hypothetical protein
MRLSKSAFDITLPVFCDVDELLGAPVTRSNGLDNFGMSDMLTLPHTFG